MLKLFYKKINIIVITLFVVLVAFTFKFFLWENLKSKFNFTGSSYQIKTPCRMADLKNIQSSFPPLDSRIKKLDRLMSKPLDWIFKDIYGNVQDLYCLRDQKNLIINFWASWCPPCIEELPSLSRLSEKYKNEIAVIVISTESLTVIQKFLKRSFSDLSSYLIFAQVSPEDKFRYFPEDQLPTTYIFNKKTLLKMKIVGARDWSEPQWLRQLLEIL